MAFRTIRLGGVALALAITGQANAQDALTAAPTIFRKVMENDRMRVLEATFKPGDKAAQHSHPDHMIYMITPGTLVIRPPGRTGYEMTHKAGEAIYLPSQTRGMENDSTETVRALIVELKTPPVRVSTRKASTRKASRGKRSARVGKRARRR